MFGDSSQDVFCAVAFLRARLVSSHQTELAFVYGKARVAPMKALSTPKLELQAALLATRLKKEILKGLTFKVTDTFMWTDSTTGLQWLHFCSKLPVFVGNRTGEILESTSTDQWHHILSGDNPADTGTRGISSEALKESSWVNGPSILRTTDWPFKPDTKVIDKIRLEGPSCDIDICLEYSSNFVVDVMTEKNFPFGKWERFNSIVKYKRAVAFLLRWLPSHKDFRSSILEITRPEKRWGFLFTCLTTRAVHIEVVPSLDTSSCVMGVERFIARRGTPTTIMSDNGTSFVGAQKELIACVESWNKLAPAVFVQKGIKWKFNPPSAPHHGGSWEQLVRSVKRVLYDILGNRRVTEEALRTTLCLVEQSLNARPITAVSFGPLDLEALTPNHFIHGQHAASFPSLNFEENFDHKKRFARA